MNWWRQLVCYTRNDRGACALGTRRRGVIVGNPLHSGSGRLSLEAAPVPGRGQAWARRPLWYLSATWQALNMSRYCSVPPSQFVKGNSVSVFPRARKPRLRERPSSVVSAYTVVSRCSHIRAPVFCRGTLNCVDQEKDQRPNYWLRISNRSVLVQFFFFFLRKSQSRGCPRWSCCVNEWITG